MDVCDALSIPLALICLYLTGSQIAFLVKKRRHRNEYTPTQSTSSDGRTQINDRHATVITIVCIIAAFSVFLKAGFDFTLILGGQNDFGCDFAYKFSVVTHALNAMAVYLALWMRQRVFYQDPRLKHLSSKFVRGVSWFIAFLFNIVILATLALFVFEVEYKGTPMGCVSEENIIETIRWIVLIVVTLIFQIVFLSLFIYPLLKHQQTLKMQLICLVSERDNSSFITSTSSST